MHLFHVNVLAVLIGTILSMGAGALWYSPKLFANQWMMALGKTKDQLTMRPIHYFAVLIIYLIVGFVLGKVFYYARVNDLMGALQIGVIVWVGFVVTTMAENYIFEGRPKKLYFINVCYHLFVILIMSVVLGLWK